MFRYILTRIIIFIPTLLIISFVVFMLSVWAPGDPVEAMLNLQGGGQDGGSMRDKTAGEEAYFKKSKELNKDLPVFYFNFTSKAYPDTLHKVLRKAHRDNMKGFIKQYANWPEIQSYFHEIADYEKEIIVFEKDSLDMDGKDALIKLKENVKNLYIRNEDDKVTKAFANIDKYASKDSLLMPFLEGKTALLAKYDAVKEKATRNKKLIPAFYWNGANNQYHKWFSKFMVGDFGMSYQDKQPIGKKIRRSIFWTMLLSFLSIILTYAISIPIGVFSAKNKGTTADGAISTILFIFYSLPTFWVATLMIIYLCNPQHLNIFPPYGIGDIPEGAGVLKILQIRAYHLILPLFCWTYPTFAFLSRQMRGGMLSVLRQDYIRTARAKGLDERTVTWKHAFRNSLLPIITLFANVFPRMIGGSIVIEVIFSIPGMGKTMLDAIVFKDYPMVFTVVLLAALLTMIGFLIADILYAAVDPRITYK